MRVPLPWSLPDQPTSTNLLLAGGVSEEMIRTQVRAGRLVRLRRGVYIAADAYPADEAQRHILRSHAEVIANLDAVISDQSAAVIWGLPSPDLTDWHYKKVSVTFARGGGHGALCRANQHRVRDLPENHVVRDRSSFPVTSVARTAVDLASRRALPQALVLLDAAARRMIEDRVQDPRRSDYVDGRLVSTVVGEIAAVAATRAPQLAEAVSLLQPCRESVPESLTAGHFHLAKIPTPEFQAEINTRAGTYFPDCYWAEYNLIGECDGKVKYRTPEAYIKEKIREQAFRDDDFRVVRWLAIEPMTRPQVVVDRVGRMMR